MAITPTDTFLYVGTSTAGIFGYSIAAGGLLDRRSIATPQWPTCRPSLANGPVRHGYLSRRQLARRDEQHRSPSAAVRLHLFLFQITPQPACLALRSSVVTNGLHRELQYIGRSAHDQILAHCQHPAMLVAASFGTGGETIYSFNPAQPREPSPRTYDAPHASRLSDDQRQRRHLQRYGQLHQPHRSRVHRPHPQRAFIFTITPSPW